MEEKIKYNIKTKVKSVSQNEEDIKRIFNEKLLNLILKFERR